MNLSRAELLALGLASLGQDVSIHRTALLYGCERIHVGDHVRIDAFSLISAGPQGISIGDHVHIASGAYLFGSGGRIELHAFAGLSSRVSVYTATDDYKEGYLTNPTVPLEFKKLSCGPVTLEEHALVGAGSILMPNVRLQQGSAIGALSFITKDVPAFWLVAGHPARKLAERSRDLLGRAEDLRAQEREAARADVGVAA